MIPSKDEGVSHDPTGSLTKGIQKGSVGSMPEEDGGMTYEFARPFTEGILKASVR